MRSILCVALFLCVTLSAASAATGRIIKVLPHFLDAQGRHTISPSLYDRDAYQAHLRDHPGLRSGMRFDVHWKAKREKTSQLRLRVEVRGTAQGGLPRILNREAIISPAWFSKWSRIAISGDDYKVLGEVTAWRVTLWDGSQLLSEQTSFLW